MVLHQLRPHCKLDPPPGMAPQAGSFIRYFIPLKIPLVWARQSIELGQTVVGEKWRGVEKQIASLVCVD